MITVNINGISYGGSGVGKVVSADREELVGITAFVPFTSPGDVVKAKVIEESKRYLKAELSSIVDASPLRVEAACKVYGICGGCNLQHLGYQSQISEKQKMILGAFVSGGLSKLEESISDLVPSPGNGNSYRRRAIFHISEDGRIGFYRQGTHDVVGVETCIVIEPKIRDAIALLQPFGAALHGKVRSISVELDKDANVFVVLKTPGVIPEKSKAKLLKELGGIFENLVLEEKGRVSHRQGLDFVELSLQGVDVGVRVPPGRFSQINWGINEILISKVVDYLSDCATVADLYAGAGNFSLPIARDKKERVISVESDSHLSALALESSKKEKLQLEVISKSVERFLKDGGTKQRFDGLIVDPPRSGLGKKVAATLPRANKLVLVSCELPSAIRDIKDLEEAGWKVERVIPFDMFPHTSYVELLTLFSRA